MDFVEWLNECRGYTWEEYERLTDFDQRELVKEWVKEEGKSK